MRSNLGTVCKVCLYISVHPGLSKIINSTLWGRADGGDGILAKLFQIQKVFPTQGLNPGFLHCRWILYQLSHCSLQSVWNTNTIAISPTHPPSYEFYVKCQFTQLLFLNRSCYRHSRCQYNSILVQSVIWNKSESCSVVPSSLRPHRLYPTGLEFARPQYWIG